MVLIENRQVTWTNFGPQMDKIESETISRLFMAFPQCRSYFLHFDSPNSKDVQHHRQKVVNALDSAIKHLDNMRGTLADLSDLHAYNLRVDPVNFKVQAKCFPVALTCGSGNEFNTPFYLSEGEFLYKLANVLCEKYT